MGKLILEFLKRNPWTKELALFIVLALFEALMPKEKKEP